MIDERKKLFDAAGVPQEPEEDELSGLDKRVHGLIDRVPDDSILTTFEMVRNGTVSTWKIAGEETVKVQFAPGEDDVDMEVTASVAY